MMDRPELYSVIRDKWRRHANRVAWHVRRLPRECMQSGDDSPLHNVWEEWVVQVQGEESIFAEAYEDVIRSICRDVAKAMPKDEQGLLWLWTEAYGDWKREKDESEDIPYGDIALGALEDELFSQVREVAANVELSERLYRYLHGL